MNPEKTERACRGKARVRLMLAGALVGAAAACAFAWSRIPPALHRPPPESVRLLDSRGVIFAEFATAEARSARPLPLDRMGPWLPAVTVAIEDHRFRAHRGFDWRATGSAFLRNLRAGRVVAGGSTITQQLVKIARGRTARAWLPKLREAFAAAELERRWSKDRILGEYLNRIDYGNRLLGPEAAARAYFDKAARNLTLAEAIYLAGLPQAPARHNPWRDPAAAERRYRVALGRLADPEVGLPAGVDRRAILALRDLPAPRPGRHLVANRAPHFADALFKAHPAARGEIATTLDADLQRRCEGLVAAHLAALSPQPVTQAAVVVLDNATGAVRALVGSAGPGSPGGEINGALLPRAAGSTLKPFIYLHAIDTRAFTAASLLPDTPDALRATFPDYDPRNYRPQHLGPVRLREALGNSLNVPAVVVLGQLGARPTFQKLREWGFRFPRGFDETGAGFVLGNVEISPLELAAAYAGLARGGTAAPPRFTAAGRGDLRRVASPEAAQILADILCDPGARRRTFGASSPLETGARTAAKTGTSTGFRDGWTAGFNARHTVAVWAGNFDAQPMGELPAVRAAAPLWGAIMRELLRDDPAWPEPAASERLRRVEVCALSGLLPCPHSPGTLPEWFLAGTEPSENAAPFFRETTGGVQVVLPPEYAEWAASPWNHLGAAAREDTALRIVSPKPDAVFLLDPALDPRQQQLEFAIAGDNKVAWTLNGRPLGEEARLYWPLQRGRWTLEAREGDRHASATFEVR